MSIGTLHFVHPLFLALAPAVEKRSLTTKDITANTAHTNATLKSGMGGIESVGGVEMMLMSKVEVSYLVTMLLFRKMMNDALLSQEEYEAFNAQMKQKNDPKIGILFTEITEIRDT